MFIQNQFTLQSLFSNKFRLIYFDFKLEENLLLKGLKCNIRYKIQVHLNSYLCHK